MQLPPTVLSLNINKNQDRVIRGTNVKKPPVVENTTGIPHVTNKKVAPGASPETGHESTETEAEKSEDDIPFAGGDTTEMISTASPVGESVMKKSPILLPPQTLETTLFERLEKMYGPSIKKMLRVQYRSDFHVQIHKIYQPLSHIGCTLKYATFHLKFCIHRN